MNDSAIIIYLFLLVFATSCGDAVQEEQPSDDAMTFTLADGRKQNDTLRPVRDLQIERPSRNVQTYLLNGKPYNGTAIHFAEGEQGFLEYHIVEGELSRMYGYYPDGTLERNFTFKEGKSHGTLIMYYPDGKKYIEERFNMGKMDGPQSRWHENGQLWRTANYKEGVLIEEEVFPKSGVDFSR